MFFVVSPCVQRGWNGILLRPKSRNLKHFYAHRLHFHSTYVQTSTLNSKTDLRDAKHFNIEQKTCKSQLHKWFGTLCKYLLLTLKLRTFDRVGTKTIQLSSFCFKLEMLGLHKSFKRLLHSLIILLLATFSTTLQKFWRIFFFGTAITFRFSRETFKVDAKKLVWFFRRNKGDELEKRMLGWCLWSGHCRTDWAKTWGCRTYSAPSIRVAVAVTMVHLENGVGTGWLREELFCIPWACLRFRCTQRRATSSTSRMINSPSWKPEIWE